MIKFLKNRLFTCVPFFVSANSKDTDDYFENEQRKNTLGDGISTGSESELNTNSEINSEIPESVKDFISVEDDGISINKEIKENITKEEKLVISSKKRNKWNQFLFDMKILEFLNSFLVKEKNIFLLGLIAGSMVIFFFVLFIVFRININR